MKWITKQEIHLVVNGEPIVEILEHPTCPTCSTIAPTGFVFKDDLSKREYEISGCCQKCQDEIFTEEE